MSLLDLADKQAALATEVLELKQSRDEFESVLQRRIADIKRGNHSFESASVAAAVAAELESMLLRMNLAV